MQVRVATEWDAHHVLECLHEAFAPYRDRYSPGGFHDTVLDHDSVIRRMREMTIFVAEADGEVVGTIGCAAAGEGEAHIRGMAVRPSWQGRGVADQLVAAAEERSRTQGCHRITLDTTEVLHRAARFYELRGYRRTGVVRDFFGMPLHEFAKELK